MRRALGVHSVEEERASMPRNDMSGGGVWCVWVKGVVVRAGGNEGTVQDRRDIG